MWGVLAALAPAIPIGLLVPEESFGLVFGMIAISILTLVAYRALTIRLCIDSEGVWARNVFANYSAKWSEIEEVSAGNSFPPFATAVIFDLPKSGILQRAISPLATISIGSASEKARCYELLRQKADEHGITFLLTYEAPSFDRPHTTSSIYGRKPRDSSSEGRRATATTGSNPDDEQDYGESGPEEANGLIRRFVVAALILAPVVAISLRGGLDLGLVVVFLALALLLTLTATLYARRGSR